MAAMTAEIIAQVQPNTITMNTGIRRLSTIIVTGTEIIAQVQPNTITMNTGIRRLNTGVVMGAGIIAPKLTPTQMTMFVSDNNVGLFYAI